MSRTELGRLIVGVGSPRSWACCSISRAGSS